MGYNIALPNITAPTEHGKLEQIRSYLYQLAEQLKWALDTIDNKTESVIVQQGSKARTVASATEEAQASFNDIKSLIITSADIVNAYYEEINQRLTGEYVAQSDFGTYTEQTEARFSQTSTNMETLYTNVQTLESEVEGVEDKLIDVEAHIRSGLLYYDDSGTPIYGLEIGQKNDDESFNKYARFTADRLSFYDQNDTEVAYISDYKLYITNVEVTGTLKLGGYRIDTDNGLAFIWEGVTS